jgi:hypothetical protein
MSSNNLQKQSNKKLQKDLDIKTEGGLESGFVDNTTNVLRQKSNTLENGSQKVFKNKNWIKIWTAKIATDYQDKPDFYYFILVALCLCYLGWVLKALVEYVIFN